MPNSPNSSPPVDTNRRRPCDFCNQSTAIFYCRADTAKLCLSCDREVHTTNPLFTKHLRSLLCDNCDSSPASIFCSTDAVVHCQNCDWEKHNKSNSPSEVHDRRPIEGFTGCPSVNDLVSILGFDDLGKGSDSFGSGHGFEDCLVWETPFVRLDDLIVNSSGYDHCFQAMGVPPLPKNRNAALGAYKEEILYQLRELAKSDPNDGQMVKPMSSFEHKSEETVNPSYELQTNTFQWCPDSCDARGGEFYSDQLLEPNTDGNCVVPDEKSNLYNSSRVDASYEGESHHDVTETTQVFHGVATREINSQERETALTRYKEKKKSRRYDKQIRYVSRKVRAESRTRIRGRFAKMDR